MNLIDHALLDRYEAVKGELERSPDRNSIDPELWEVIDQLLLDLHMLRHGYTNESYARFVERRLKEMTVDGSIVQRLKEIRL